MPNAYILNQRPMGNGPAVSNIIEMLVGAGWTYQSSGTGTNGIFSPTPTTVTISNASPGIVSWTTHGLLPNVPVVFTTSGTLPPEITAGQTYFITAANFTANSFAVSATLGGAAINTSAASTATTTGTVKKVFTSAVSPTTVSISNGTPCTVYWPTHGLRAGDSFRFSTSGSLPSSLSNSTTYFVLSTGITTDTFRFSTSVEGAAVNTTTAGNGIHTATVLTSWGNANAWARLQDPAGVREFLFQHDGNTSGSGAGGKVRYSSSTKFTGISNGAISATVPPTAVDERYLRGSSSTYGALWMPAGVFTGSCVMQGAAMSSAPYGWWFCVQIKGGGSRQAGMLYDPVISVAEDPDPYVLHIGAFNGSVNEAFSINTSSLGRDGSTTTPWTLACGGTQGGSFAFMDINRTAFLYVQPLGYACVASSGGQMGIITGAIGTATSPAGTSGNVAVNQAYIGNNTFTNLPEALPVPWVRLGFASTNSQTTQQSGVGFKGWSTMMRYTGANRVSFVDTLNNKAWICVGAFWLPWDGTTTPVN